MSEDRWVKETPTPGEDPREIDRERTSPEAVDDVAGQEGLVHPQERAHGIGTSSDAPGRDVDDLRDEDAPDVPQNRDRP